MRAFAAALVVATCTALTAHGSGSELVTREVYVMGTRARLATYAATRNRGLATLDAALGALERAEAELSTWRESSDISALNRQPVRTPWQASPTLCRMFADIWNWYEASAGAFDPGIGRLLSAWDTHGAGILPDAETQRRAKAVSGLALLTFDRTRCTLTRRDEVAIDVGAFGKGEALDRVAAALDGELWLIDLGGQVAVGGDVPDGGWPIAIADPRARNQAYLQVQLVEGSLSTSGGSERDLVVNGKRVGHIFDPRTGEPASFNGSVTVWHRSSLAADALSTALFVMGPESGLQWAEARGIAALYLIPDAGGVRVEATKAFRNLRVIPTELE